MLTSAAIHEAQIRIGKYVLRTPLIPSPAISRMTGHTVYAKLENLQISGSFKIRGALNAILLNPDLHTHEGGVVAASAGNHAQGVAVAARIAGVPATIVMPEWTSLTKQEAVKGYGANVILAGKTIEECVVHAEEVSKTGKIFIHPFDDYQVIAGQGTIGLEIMEELPDLDAIIIPIGGGGLIAGVAFAVKSINPKCKIIGVQVEQCPSVSSALQNRGPVCTPAAWTLADGIRVSRTGELTYPIIEDLVDEILNVREDEIARAILCLMERKRIITEGAGAAPLAALLSGRCSIRPESSVALVISGGNVDTHLLGRIVRRALILEGRIMQLSIDISHRPGSLAALLGIIAEKNGNILHIHHQAGDPNIPMDFARVEIELETRSDSHREEIKTALMNSGYQNIQK